MKEANKVTPQTEAEHNPGRLSEHLETPIKNPENQSPGKKKNPNSVFTYIAILFGVAFLLLLLSYFMQQRNTAEMLEGLQTSATAMENIEMLQKRNLELEKEVDELTEQVDALTKQTAALTGQLAESEAQGKEAAGQVEALSLFWQVVKAYEGGAYRTCRSLIAQMEEKELAAHLPAAEGADAAGLFERIQNALD